MTQQLPDNTISAPAQDENGVTQYLTFSCAGERLAVSILDVKELIEVSNMTRVPMTPDYIRGVINLRGSVVPIVDLSARLSRKPCELTKRSSIVLVEVHAEQEALTLGMLVDEVNEILELDAANIQPPPSFGANIRTDFIRAMGNVNDEFIILLAIDKVLSVEELSTLNELTTDEDTHASVLTEEEAVN